jgi:hypothetical protein
MGTGAEEAVAAEGEGTGGSTEEAVATEEERRGRRRR